MSTPATQLFVLGHLAAARGQLGPAHSRVTDRQMDTATTIVTDSSSYGRVGTTVVCVEDRLHRLDPRLAGGALSLALMRNLLYGGSLLSEDLRDLKARGFRLALHDDCGALALVAKGFVASQLSDVNAEGYKLLAAMGYDVPMNVRKRIALWARNLPASYVDLETGMKFVDELDQIVGAHNAVFAAVSQKEGVSFIGGPQFKKQTHGLLSFVFDPWAARSNARRMTDSQDDASAAETLALLFTAQVFLTLGGPDLRIALHR